MAAVEAVSLGAFLSVVGIGTHLPGRAYVKHKVKAIDRLLSAPLLQSSLNRLFAAVAALLIPPGSRPVLLIDWTRHGAALHSLAVSIPHQGRSLQFYVELHPTEVHQRPSVETRFLDTLHREILPQGCRPIICADSGFRNPFFRDIQRLGWDYVGRLTARIYLQPKQAVGDMWLKTDAVMIFATKAAQDLGECTITQNNPLQARVVTVYGRQNRLPCQQRTPSPVGDRTTRRYRKRADEPWVLVTSLTAERASAAEVVSLYRLRMQIEEGFRDDKNRDTGIGLNSSRTKSLARMRVLRAIGVLVGLITQIIGRLGEKLGLHRRYQSNTFTRRRLISIGRLGRLMLLHEDRRRLTHRRIQGVVEDIRQDILTSLWKSRPATTAATTT